MQTVLLPITFDESNHGEWHVALSKVARFSIKLGLNKEQLKKIVSHLDNNQISFTLNHYTLLITEIENNKNRFNPINHPTNHNPNRSDPNKTTFPTRAYERLAIVPIETVFKNMQGILSFKVNATETTQVIVKSKRYLTFHKKGVACVRCGIEGHYFAVERQFSKSNQPKSDKWHLNLYHLDPITNKETMMTIDHTIPKSRPGSSNKIENLEPMCCICNHSKGNMTEEELAASQIK